MSHIENENYQSLQKKEYWSLQEGRIAVLRAAVDSSARHVHWLYFTFLVFVFYVWVTVFSTDDEQLLKEAPIHPPLPNVELPLVEFYLIIPWLVLFLHAYLLTQFFLLSRRLFDLNDALKSLPSDLERTQRNLPFPLIFSHRIIGIHHPEWIQWALRMWVTATILLAPIVLLLTIQLKFLPYHDGWITFGHQLALTFDLLLLWFYWPRLFSRSDRWRDWWSESGHWHVWGPVLTILMFIGSWDLLVPPGGGVVGIERWIGYQKQLDKLVHRNLVLNERTLMRKDPPVELLFAEHLETDEKQRKIWQEVGEGLNLRGRDLRYAKFYKSKFWNVNLWKAQLRGARLHGAQLQGANLKKAQLQDANLMWARLQGTNLGWAQLQGVDLRLAQLQGADLRWAWLQGANLQAAQLQGAYLWKAQLQGADLRGVDLRGVDLRGADLQCADLRGAVVYGTDFREVELSRTDLRDLHSFSVGQEGSEERIPLGEPDWDPLPKIEYLVAGLKREGEHGSENGRKQLEKAIERLQSLDSNLPLKPAVFSELEVFSPPREFDVMHNRKYPFEGWQKPPDEATFKRKRANCLAELACDNQYIAERMWWQANRDRGEGDPVLEEVLWAKARSKDCSVLAKVIEKDQ